MSFTLKQGASARSLVRGLGREQVGRSIERLREGDAHADHEIIHDARKGARKARAIARLVRPAAGREWYVQVNTTLRDAARILSPARDAEARLEVLDSVLAGMEEPDRAALTPVRQWFSRQCDEEVEHASDPRADARVIEMLEAGRGLFKSMPFRKPGFGLIGPGLVRTYRRARRAMRAAKADPSPENLHEWRKRVKDHRGQLEALEGLRGCSIKRRCRDAKRCSDLLGLARDLSAIARTVVGECSVGPSEARDHLAEACASKAAAAIGEAWPIGERLLADRPRVLAKRFRRSWRRATR